VRAPGGRHPDAGRRSGLTPRRRSSRSSRARPPLARADAKVDLNLSKSIQQARLAKKMTQDQLAKQLNIDKKIITEYENGKAIPNGQVIAKIERALGAKLPRPGKK